MKSFVKYAKTIFGGATMYRSMLYYLIFLVAAAILLSAFDLLPYDPVALGSAALYLCAISYIANLILGKAFKSTANPESQFITALILTLIVGPVDLARDIASDNNLVLDEEGFHREMEMQRERARASCSSSSSSGKADPAQR